MDTDKPWHRDRATLYTLTEHTDRYRCTSQVNDNWFSVHGPDAEAVAERIRLALAAPSAAGRDRSWPANYQETFDAIAKATTVHPNGSLGISVKAFYRALSYPEMPCENRYDASETLTNPAAPTETITPTARLILGRPDLLAVLNRVGGGGESGGEGAA